MIEQVLKTVLSAEEQAREIRLDAEKRAEEIRSAADARAREIGRESVKNAKARRSNRLYQAGLEAEKEYRAALSENAAENDKLVAGYGSRVNALSSEICGRIKDGDC